MCVLQIVGFNGMYKNSFGLRAEMGWENFD